MNHTPPYFATRADDFNGWCPDTGKPGEALFSSAVQVWCVMQEFEATDESVGMVSPATAVTLGAAAEAFKCPPEMVAIAVEAHPYMFLSGDKRDPATCTIEHDGE
jgi:hypothetical protein